MEQHDNACLRKTDQQIFIGAWGDAGIRNIFIAVEHHASCAFEEIYAGPHDY